MYSELSQEILSLEKKLTQDILCFEKHFLSKKYGDVFLEDEKKSIKKDWKKISQSFLKLKKIRNKHLPKWHHFLQKNYDKTTITYYLTLKYYYFTILLHKTFQNTEGFIRLYLDENFQENYSTIARYIYRRNFLYFLNYPKKFLLLFEKKVSPDLHWMLEIKKEFAFDLYFDYKNIFYHIKYKFEKPSYFLTKIFGVFLAHIRFKVSKKGNIGADCIEYFKKNSLPGDILLSRKLYVSTNMTIPGFWKHMAMYLGTGRDIKKISKNKNHKHLINNEHYIIESTYKGVEINTFDRYISEIDYLGTFRPLFSSKKIKSAIIETLSHENTRYDYHFNYYSQEGFICSELITKSYLKKDSQDEGLTIELKKLFSGLTYPPNEFVKKVQKEIHLPNKQIIPIVFIDYIKKGKKSFINTPDELLKSHLRSKGSFFLK